MKFDRKKTYVINGPAVVTQDMETVEYSYEGIEEELRALGHASLVNLVVEFMNDYKLGKFAKFNKGDSTTRITVFPVSMLARICEIFYKGIISEKQFIENLEVKFDLDNLKIIELVQEIKDLYKTENKTNWQKLKTTTKRLLCSYFGSYEDM